MRPLSLLLAALASTVLSLRALDLDANGRSDVWEAVFDAAALSGGADDDGDFASNAEEAAAGTDPRDPASRPTLRLRRDGPGLRVEWPGVAGKRYELRAGDTPDAPAPALWAARVSAGGEEGFALPAPPGAGSFLHLAITDVDRDSDGLSDYEEAQLGLHPGQAHTERFAQTDAQRVAAAWNLASTVTLAVLDGELREDWPDGALLAVRRSGGARPLRVAYTLSGSAAAGSDYRVEPAGEVLLPAGARESWIELIPLPDAPEDPAETITVTLLAGPGYTLGAETSVSVTLHPASALPGGKEAARFLIQAAFGPSADDPSDPDPWPENVEEVMALGFAGWIDDQFARPLGLHQPFTEWVTEQENQGIYWEPKLTAWWNRAMGVPALRPGEPAQAADPLRQRMAFALSQILVVSDRPEVLAVDPIGLANYYDLLVTHAFGNYRDLLFEVARHPCMGFYLSHVKNRPPNPALNLHPDENFAREIMQLFSIGLWELHPDGTRKRDGQGRPIPTYGNAEITEMARVFTGFSYAEPGVDDFAGAYHYFRQPMRMWDAFHDLNPKTLVGGVELPARTASDPDTGAAGLADVQAAIDALFHHPNVGPFLGRQLIQRFVTSNPSTGYVARVSAAFADNGAGVRGDLRAVLRTLLLDPEARDPARRDELGFGKLREPFLRAVNLAHATQASAPVGAYPVYSLGDLLAQEPYRSPSVFNFYLPGYSPPGAVWGAGLVAPEFQILTSATAISGPNYFRTAIEEDFNRWGAGRAQDAVRCDITHELTLVNDPDALLRRLDLALTGGTLSGREFQLIRDALLRLDSSHWEWQRQRVQFALYMIVNSPDFTVLR
jgi:uncharacterized protein (DUF1800 family)